MKRLVVCLLFLAGACFAADVPKYDAYWWAQQSDTFKLGWVIGYTSAKENDLLFISSSCMGMKFAAGDNKGPCEHPGMTMNFDNVTMGQFVEGIDAFYKDFRNKQLSVFQAIAYAKDQVQGLPQAELDKEVESWRRCNADSKACADATRW
jgi:hypothetical protein